MIFSSYQGWSVTAFSRPPAFAKPTARQAVLETSCPPGKALNQSCHPFNPHFDALVIERLTLKLFRTKFCKQNWSLYV
jgi:hypothetical protein